MSVGGQNLWASVLWLALFVAVAAVIVLIVVLIWRRRGSTTIALDAADTLSRVWLAAVVLAFGPEVYVHGKAIGPRPYALLHQYVPGFNGMRVPARFFMVATLFLTCLGGLGFAALATRW